jgi:UDP-glucose 4-epimerase
MRCAEACAAKILDCSNAKAGNCREAWFSRVLLVRITMAVLVTGGAGYIGSATVELLLERGEDVVILDNLSRGFSDAVPAELPFYRANVGDRELVCRIVQERKIESCIHLAGLAYVGESVTDPASYFDNNVVQGIALADSLRQSGVTQIVFSSSCATYGEPRYVPIDENHPQQPMNPYGWSKLCLERVLGSYSLAYGFRSVSLRYFNAAGATARHGERHDPEPHLIPNVLGAAAGELPSVRIFGAEYPTPDGTAIRDYIHVSDLAAAHVLALAYLRDGGPAEAMNLGTGEGFSVMEVVAAARRLTGREIPVEMLPARIGDPSRLVAKADKAKQRLGWEPEHSGLDEIIRSAWAWHLKGDRRNRIQIEK